MTQTLQAPPPAAVPAEHQIRFIVTQQGQPQFAVIDYDLYLLIKDQLDAILAEQHTGAIKTQTLASDQSWYWTPEWQAGEAEAEADLRAGRFRTFATVDDFLGFLDSDDEQ